MIKSYLKSYSYLVGLILIMTIILAIVSYFFNVTNNIIKVIIPIIAILISSIILGRNINEKAYIHGIKFISIYILVMTIFKLFFKTGFNYKVIIVYIIMIFTSIIGSMIGINIKKK